MNGALRCRQVFEIDEGRIKGAREKARKEGVSHLVEFRKQDAQRPKH